MNMVRDPVCLMKFDLREAEAMAVVDGRAWYFCSEGCREHFLEDTERYRGNAEGQRLAVGVMGSAAAEPDPALLRQAERLGEAIGDAGLILVTGACPGLPHACAQGARSRDGLSVGISPALSLDEHLHKYHSPADAFDVMVYTGSGLMGREVTNIRSSDMVVIVGGRSGTLGEFAIAYDEGKLIGVLSGSGGITDALREDIRNFDKDTGAEVLYDADPGQLVAGLIDAYSRRHFRRPSCFCGDGQATEG